jgi:head-tail adaptor
MRRPKRSRAGDRINRVRFDQEVATQDSGGGDEVTWVALTTERCRIERLQSFRAGVEQKVAGGSLSTPPVRIHVLAHTLTKQITNAMRGVDLDGGTVFNIESVQDLEGRGRELIILAVENKPT